MRIVADGVLSSPLDDGLEQTQNGIPQKIRKSILNVRDLLLQFLAGDQSVLLHPTEMLVEHLLRDRSHSSFEFPDSDRTVLKFMEDCDSPFPLNQRDRPLDHGFI